MFSTPAFILAGILAVLNICTGAYAYSQHERALVAESNRDALKTELSAAKAANVTNTASIKTLRQTNSVNAIKAAEATDAANKATEQATRLGALVTSQGNQVRSLREKLYASDAKLRAWGAIAVPDSYVGVLRDRWNAVDGDSVRRGAAGSPGPIHPAPD